MRAHASLSGRTYGIIDSIDKDGGLQLAAAAGAAPAPATTTTLEGRWIADRSVTMSYPGGFDGFFNALLTLNDAGRAAKAAYDPLSDENPEASCVGRPTPAALVSTSLYLMEIDIREEEQTVVLRSEYFDEVERVHGMPEHQDPSEVSLPPALESLVGRGYAGVVDTATLRTTGRPPVGYLRGRTCGGTLSPERDASTSILNLRWTIRNNCRAMVTAGNETRRTCRCSQANATRKRPADLWRASPTTERQSR